MALTFSSVPFAPPRSLSPSKVSSFTSCPLAFRFTTIEGLPEPASPHLVKGTLVHLALERLMWRHPRGQRTLRSAHAELAGAWADLQDDPEVRELALSEEESEAFFADASVLVANYFQLEDPNDVNAVGIELGLAAQIGGTLLRGIIDRLDVHQDGRLLVIDYKTGRAPPPQGEHGRLSGVHIYALLCQRVLGRTPDEVRLLYLRDPLTLSTTPSAQSVRGHQRRAEAVWTAIEKACATEDFRPRPSALCNSCHFRSRCPAFGEVAPGSLAS